MAHRTSKISQSVSQSGGGYSSNESYSAPCMVILTGYIRDNKVVSKHYDAPAASTYVVYGLRLNGCKGVLNSTSSSTVGPCRQNINV